MVCFEHSNPNAQPEAECWAPEASPIDGRLSQLTAIAPRQMLFALACHMEENNFQKISTAIDGILSGDKAALGTVYDMYGKVVYSVSLKILGHPADAEEATQDAFLSLWENAASLSGKPEKMVPWLVRVVRNRSIDKLRKLNRRPPSSQAIETPEQRVVDSSHAEKSTALDALLGAERADHIRKALDLLPAEQKTVIEMAYYQGFSQSEIAEELKESLGTVKSRTRYALTRLRKELEGCHVI